MDASELQVVKSEYVTLARYYRTILPNDLVQMYAEDLEDLPLDAVTQAMVKLRRQPGRRTLPLPADIREACAPGAVTGRAQDIAGRIGEAISRFGYTHPQAAREYIGTVGWAVCERMGGWTHICNTLTADRMGTFHAQCREMARSLLDIDEAALLPELPTLESGRGRKRPVGLQPASAVISQIAAFAR